MIDSSRDAQYQVLERGKSFLLQLEASLENGCWEVAKSMKLKAVVSIFEQHRFSAAVVIASQQVRR